MSDIAGQDPSYHKDDPKLAIKRVRNWLAGYVAGDVLLPSPRSIYVRQARFGLFLELMLRRLSFDRSELNYNDYTTFVVRWLRANPR